MKKRMGLVYCSFSTLFFLTQLGQFFAGRELWDESDVEVPKKMVVHHE